MKKIVITGATSFIGRHLIRRLVQDQYEITAVVRDGRKAESVLPEDEKIRIVELDLHEYGRLKEKVDDSCDAFVSLAWNGTRGQARNDPELQRMNYECSMKAVQQAVQMGCRRLISAGSQAEYGPMRDMVDEDAPCAPNTQYGIWKYEFYKDCCQFCRRNGVSFKEPRFFSLYGEDDDENTLVLSAVDKMLANRECQFTECRQLWDFLYIDDAVEGIIRLLHSDCGDGAYNFGYGDIRPLRDFVLDIYRLTGSQSRLLFGAVPYPATGMVNVCPDTRRLRDETQWTPSISFEDGIRRIINLRRKMRAR